MKKEVLLMKTKLYSRDILLILAASFCYFSSPMLVTPLITGFAGSVGASAALMGVIGGLMNLCSLFCRPLVGNLADRLSKYKVSTAGAALMSLACLGYILSSHPAGIVFFRVVNGVGFACCSVCQSTAILLAGKGKRGLANSTYYIGLDLGMTLGPVIGGFLYGRLDLAWFYPALVLTVPLGVLVYLLFMRKS